MIEKEIDKMIENLEKQKNDLLQQKRKLGFQKLVEKLNERVRDAIKRGYKIKAIYISSAFYEAMKLHWSGVINQLPMIERETAKWQGYPLYNNWNLNYDEIHIAI